jgi:hypothetical protein
MDTEDYLDVGDIFRMSDGYRHIVIDTRQFPVK